MASEALVDLSYHGLVLGKRVRLLQVGPRSAYVAHDAPMPVGTELVLTVDETLAIPAQVARVREGDAKDGPAGMWLWADAAEQRARAWWDAHVTADDPRIPEPASGGSHSEEPPAPAAASLDATPEAQVGPAGEPALATIESEPPPGIGQVEAGDTAPETPADASASDAGNEHIDDRDDRIDDRDDRIDEDGGEDDDYAIEIRRAATSAPQDHAGAEASDAGAGASEEDAPPARGNSHGRQVRGTQVMTAMEIEDVLGMPPVVDGEGAGDDPAGPEDRPREIRTTHVMTAVEVAEVLAGGDADEPAPADDSAARGKARGKRRARKRR